MQGHCGERCFSQSHTCCGSLLPCPNPALVGPAMAPLSWSSASSDLTRPGERDQWPNWTYPELLWQERVGESPFSTFHSSSRTTNNLPLTDLCPSPEPTYHTVNLAAPVSPYMCGMNFACAPVWNWCIPTSIVVHIAKFILYMNIKKLVGTLLHLSWNTWYLSASCRLDPPFLTPHPSRLLHLSSPVQKALSNRSGSKMAERVAYEFA